MLKKFLSNVTDFMSLVKFAHTLFALPFACMGYFVAVNSEGQSFSVRLLVLVLLCMLFARNAAMGFNRYTDRFIDKSNPRTALREIPAEIIRPNSALFFVIINSLLFILTTFFINRLCFFLSPVALLVILGYSFTKRFMSFSHLVLGLGLSLAPIGAYLAVTGKFAMIPIFISFIVLFWVSGFDIIYALQDYDFDLKRKLKSVPVWLGKKNALLLSAFFHLISVVFVLLFGWAGNFGIYYWTGALIFTVLIVYQHLLVKPNDLSKLNLAFFTLNGIASLLYAVFAIVDFYL